MGKPESDVEIHEPQPVPAATGSEDAGGAAGPDATTQPGAATQPEAVAQTEDAPPTGEQTASGGGEGAAPLSAEEQLALVQTQTRERLDALIVSETQLRERIAQVNEQVLPMLKRIQELELKLKLDAPPLSQLRQRAAEEAKQHGLQIKVLSQSFTSEAELRTEVLEAWLRRFQNVQKTTIEPTNAWYRTIVSSHENAAEAHVEVTRRMETLERRWLPEAGSATGGSEAAAPIVPDSTEVIS